MQNHSSRDWKDWVKLRCQAEMLRGLWKQTRKEEAEQTFWLAEESDTTLQLSRRKEKAWMENKLGRKDPFLAEEIYLLPMEMALINPWASWEDWFILSKGAIWQLHIWASQTFTAYYLLAAGLKPQRNQLLNWSSLGKVRKKTPLKQLSLSHCFWNGITRT